MKLHWEKQSYKSYAAKVGELRISIRRSAIAPYKWFVWEVFGSFLVGKRRNALWQAMADAEHVAERVLRKAASDFASRPHGGGTINGS